MSDKYDKAIEYFNENPDEIVKIWNNPIGDPNGCLFQYVSETGRYFSNEDKPCGCLVQIRGYGECACTKELTDAIYADTRIPRSENCITLANLHVFAEWQRRIDKELNRK